MESTRQHLLRVSDIIGEIDEPAALAAAAGAEGRALQALQGRAARTSSCGRRRSATSGIWPRRSRWARSWPACAPATSGGRRRWRPAEAAVEAERLAVTEETDGAGGGEGRAVRAVEQGAARHAARQHHEDGGDGRWRRGPTRAAGRSTSCARGRPAQAGDIEEIAARLTEIDGAADASERAYEAQALLQETRRATLAAARRELDAAQAEIAAARASIARREAESRPARCTRARICGAGRRAWPPRRRRRASALERAGRRGAAPA